MTKDIVIQVFLDLEQFADIKDAADSRKMTYKNNSDLIRKTLFDYTKKVSDIVVSGALIDTKLGALRENVAQKDAIIEGLRHQIHDLNNEKERLEGNLAIKIKKAEK